MRNSLALFHRAGGEDSHTGRLDAYATNHKHLLIANQQGEVANPANPPSGCYFHPRCAYALEVCRAQAPVWEEVSQGHFVRCHRARELQLSGVEGLESTPHQPTTG